MADNGRFATLSCQEIPNNDGTTDIKVEQLTSNPDGIGTTKIVSGVLHPNGTFNGEVTEIDNGKTILQARTDGVGFVTVPTLGKQEPLSDTVARALKDTAKDCKRMLSLAPG